MQFNLNMIEPILSLAISIQSNPGIYALLLGSGLSRSAGIPTGWDIVLDLVRKLARLLGEDCEPSPDQWYRTKYGEEPDYSKLLNEIAKSPAERQQLLRSYFEPSEEEREQGLKAPTAAHRAIAEMVSQGYIKVILTTNFDRLMEKALEEVGVAPTVISSSDHIRGTLPLVHTKCTLIKINGDYLDTRIKNTPAELAAYDELWSGLLDRVFDEYGLVIAGWSALWDTALRAAIERCSSHRFTTFWAARDKVDGLAKELLERRRGVLIEIDGADSFFQKLAEKVSSLDEINRPHPVSAQVAVATLKRYLPEDRHRIRARDLVLDEAKRLRVELASERFPVDVSQPSPEDLTSRMQQYEALTEPLLSLFITGGYWGETQHESIWSDCVGLIADYNRIRSGISGYLNLRDYPALLLTYGGGIAAVAAKKYGNLASLLVRPSSENPSFQREEPLAYLLNADVIISREIAQEIIDPGKRNYTPAHDYLALVLREPMRDILLRDAQFDICFDRFEYLWTLLHIDLRVQLSSSSRWVIGRYLWRDQKHYDFKETIREQLYREMDEAGEGWPGLKAGLFGGSLERLQQARKELDEAWSRLRQSLGIAW
jgi:hypothetical protein